MMSCLTPACRCEISSGRAQTLSVLSTALPTVPTTELGQRQTHIVSRIECGVTQPLTHFAGSNTVKRQEWGLSFHSFICSLINSFTHLYLSAVTIQGYLLCAGNTEVRERCLPIYGVHQFCHSFPNSLRQSLHRPETWVSAFLLYE